MNTYSPFDNFNKIVEILVGFRLRESHLDTEIIFINLNSILS